MDNTLSESEQQIIQTEESTLDGVLDSLQKQLKKREEKLKTEELRARELTSQIVASTRLEDKALLASDEAVAHGMRTIQKDESSVLQKIIAQPYFARLVVQEELPNGSTKEFEYRIGLRENSECRIVDWKRAPIAKLFYEYKEGDDYAEDILGKERVGQISLRNQLEIKNSSLKRISSSAGEFIKKGESWQKVSEQLSSGSSDNTLPEIASLLSAEQFSLIRENLNRSLLIQGVAGSGKTSIAVHRLAWLIGGQEEIAQAENVLALVLTLSLKNYVSETLPKLGVTGVKIEKAPDWIAKQFCRFFPEFSEPHPLSSEIIPRRPETEVRRDIQRLKNSHALLKVVQDLSDSDLTPQDLLISALKLADQIIAADKTRLINRQLIKDSLERTEQNFSNGCVDSEDQSLLLLIMQLQSRKTRKLFSFDHVFIDEAQDFRPSDLALALSAAKNASCITMVGDTAQKIDSGSDFLGWENLRSIIDHNNDESAFVTLKLNYRSTLQIRRLAEYVRNGGKVEQDSGRDGRVPIWFCCRDEEQAFETACSWISTALEKYPTKVTVIACKDSAMARNLSILLKGKYQNLVRLADSKNFSFEAGIVVSEISLLRGLEFTNLLLWNPTHRDFPKDETHRNLLYLALTRARENVSIVSYAAISQILPASSSKLIRFFDYSSEEPEEREDSKTHYGQ